MPNGTGGALFTHLQTKVQGPPPFVLITNSSLDQLDEFKDYPVKLSHGYLQKPVVLKDLASKLAEVLGEQYQQLAKEPTTVNQERYQRVSIIQLYRLREVVCDVYLKLSAGKMIKIFNQGTTYSCSDLDKYCDKGVDYLYVAEQDFDSYYASYLASQYMIEQSELSAEQLPDAVASSLKAVRGMIHSVGVTPRVERLVVKSIEHIEHQVDADQKISQMLNSLRSRNDYLADHSYLMAFLTSAVCREMDWASNETQQKLAYASLLHDALLVDITMATELEMDLAAKIDVTQDERSEFRKHPYLMANLITQSDTIPENVSSIIANHHEMPDGSGYPRGLRADQVSQMDALFIVVHCFVDQFYKADLDQGALKGIAHLLEVLFNQGHYKSPMVGLLQVLGKRLF